MKKFITSILFSLILLNVSAESNNDTTIAISGIEYSACIGGYTNFNGILTGNLFTIKLYPNGDVILSCPVSNPKKVFGSSKICLYSGQIAEKKYEKLCKFILRNDFMNMQDRYTQDMEDVGCNIYVFHYNGVKKIIIDEHYNIKFLKRLKHKIIQLRDKVKWTPVVD